ncbi:MAG: peptidoglycan DD-metalloendopeptidase family protein [Patescibacteria group bacterium]|jgi:murein DD-endopeptidase MepM/ murein hydrolase activator NlpD|nr:peptidoglycan DD-metalloendopeptidase family protein [Patescibacteria group bacterium]MDP6756191.1 peptidoglycan DD-metalloendopeptidase family protein [Patescibacteria group bacterium]
MQNKAKTKIIGFWVVLGLMIISNPGFAIAQEDGATGKDPEIQDIAQQLKTQRDAIDEVRNKIDQYESKIQAKRNEALTIKNQLGSLSDQVDQTKLKLELKRQEITEINLLITETEKRISGKEIEISQQKEKIAEFIRLLYQRQQKSPVEILLANDAFSEFFDAAQYLEAIEEDLEVILKKMKAVQEKLQEEHTGLESQREELKELKAQLTGTQVVLEEKVTAKNVILEATQADESKFQALLKQVRAEQAQINNDIIGLERQLRARLEAQGDKTLAELSGQGFIWPVPNRTVTATFHDPDYPFRRYFEHPAIDIRSKQGTPIKAVGSGYVARTRDGGLGYSYISVIHADGLSSVYGHVSCILVQEDEYVVQGQVIGCSGATPGTPGAGRLTTGPHLHLEIRLNGIPVNPIGYLQ